jgi:UDP-glucose 4-epimerase
MRQHEPEYIFHLASKATVKMDGNEPFDIIQDNILSTQKICQWSPKGARVVLASSVIVYGDWMFQQESPRPYAEEDRTEPTSIYGMTKRASEGSIRYHSSTGQINGVSARMCATVGRGLTHGVVYDFIRKILNNPVLEALGSKPGSTKPYCHIDDLVQALLILAMNKDVSGEYNIVPDDAINIEEVAKAVMSGLDVYKNIEWLGEKSNWKGDNRLISVSNEKMKSLGWKPSYKSKEAIAKAVGDMA